MRDVQAGSTASDRATFAHTLSSALSQRAAPHCQAWSDEKLEDDVVRLSYEQALRSQAKRMGTGSEVDPETLSVEDVLRAKDRAAFSAETCETPAAGRPESARKTASITVRLTKPECEKLHLRAAEARLTVSAYLRSCAFEVESLRAQVKEALARISRPASAGGNPDAPPAQRDHRRLRLFPRWKWRHRVPDA